MGHYVGYYLGHIILDLVSLQCGGCTVVGDECMTVSGVKDLDSIEHLNDLKTDTSPE